MTSKPDGLDHPRIWLRDVVQFTLDELIADPLNMPRAYTAMNVVLQYHERLFYDLTRSGKAPADSLEAFRARLNRACPSFDVLTRASDSKAGHTLAYTNILHAGALLDILGSGAKAERHIITAEPKRRLIPLLEDVASAYRRVLDESGI